MGNCCGSRKYNNKDSSLMATTSLDLESGHINWRIENFRLLALSNKVAGGNMNDVAYTFSFGNEISVPAKYKLYLALEKDVDDPKIGLFLKPVRYTGEEELWITCSYRIDSLGNQLSAQFTHPQNFKDGSAWGWTKVAHLSRLLANFVNSDGSLVILLKIKQFTRQNPTFNEVQPYKYKKTLTELNTQNCQLALIDFSNMLNTGSHSDCKIIVDGKEMFAHKSILSVRSPVFEAMFQSDMQERRSGTIIVSDISHNTMKLVLEYLYCGCLYSLGETGKIDSLTELIYAADKYSLTGLMDLCEQYMIMRIDRSNALDLYSLAKRHRMQKAIPVFSEYIGKHFQQILKTSLDKIVA